MKNKKKLYITIGAAVLLLILSIVLYLIFRDKNKLNFNEKKWVNDKKDSLVDIRILNDVNTFGIDGAGVFYDYINSLGEYYKLNINPSTFSLGTYTSGVTFNIGNTLSPSDIVFYTDHYVLVSKEDKVLSSTTDLNGATIGVLNSELSYISYYLENTSATFTQFDSKDTLLASLSTTKYIIVPLNLYLNSILENGYKINYHFSDINQYYYLKVGDDKVFASILQKYYNIWSSDDFDTSYYKNLFNVYTKSLSITDVELHELTSKEYNYGVVDNRPYEMISSGNFGGINNLYLNGFKKMTGTDFNAIKYKSYDKLNTAVNKKKIDLYFNNYSSSNDFTSINTLMIINYDIIAKNEKDIVINSLNSLKGKNVYILKNTPLYDYFNGLNLATIKTYDNINNVQGLINDGEIVIIDSSSYNLYRNTIIKNALTRYSGSANNVYGFKSNCGSVFNKLFSNYLQTIDSKLIKVSGVADYSRAYIKGNILGGLISYSLYIVIGGSLISYIVYRYSKKAKIVKKIKKEDKIKYIDMLTSLKNRNYLNEHMEKWDQNNIYPQTTIIVDLNNIKYINDTYGHNEGDKQIKACANILIKTQLDNSEIVRTDGNEFLVYLIGYEEKQIGSYIHKLNKELEKLPYNYGAAIGYSIISDDLKLIDDAINEATIEMRKNKDKED